MYRTAVLSFLGLEVSPRTNFETLALTLVLMVYGQVIGLDLGAQFLGLGLGPGGQILIGVGAEATLGEDVFATKCV